MRVTKVLQIKSNLIFLSPLSGKFRFSTKNLKVGQISLPHFFYASARGFIRLRLLRREDTLALIASNIFFISVTAIFTEKKNFNE